MTPTEYIKNCLENCSKAKEKTVLKYQKETLEEQLFKIITRKEFRKWSLAVGSEERIKTAISYALKKQKPLNFVFEFGGYKLWRLSPAPEIDWAEFFMLCHYASFLAPIAKIYPYGVNFNFASDDVMVERMNNIKSSAMDSYCNSFNHLLDIITPYLPNNVKFKLVRLAELYDSKEELEAELKRTFAENKKAFLFWSDEKKQKMLQKAELNFCKNSPLALKDLSNITDEEYNIRIIDGTIYHDAFEACHKRREFVLGRDKILVFCTSIPNALAIGTTKASVTKFWTSVGALEKHQDGFKPVIFAPSVWESFDKKSLVYKEIDWQFAYPSNLKKIPILEGRK